MQTVQLMSPPDLEHFDRWLLRLVEHHSDLPVTLQKQEGRLSVGILNFTPDEEDWFQRPVEVQLDPAFEMEVGIDKVS
jgi:hypothetical protein